jgi:hypothetical protein
VTMRIFGRAIDRLFAIPRTGEMTVLLNTPESG